MIMFNLIFNLIFSSQSKRQDEQWFIDCLCLGTTFFHVVEGLSLIDSFYFCNMSLSSVGFGDIVPVTALGKLGATVMALFGMGIYSSFLTSTTTRVNECLGLGLISNLLLCLIFGAILFSLIENWSLFQSLYFMIIMSTTVGYGDVTPSTVVGKLLCVVWSWWSVQCVAEGVMLCKESLATFVDVDLSPFMSTTNSTLISSSSSSVSSSQGMEREDETEGKTESNSKAQNGPNTRQRKKKNK